MFASPLFWQIRYLVTNLNKKNIRSSIAELNQLIGLYGEDARLFLLQCLVEETGFKEQKAHAHQGNKDAQRIQLLQHEVAQAAEEPNFVSAICRALEGFGGGIGRERAEQSHTRHTGRGGTQGQQGPHRITEEFLLGFCRVLKLTPPQQVAVGLGLSRSPNPGVAKEGVKFLVARVPGLASGGGGQLSLEALHSLLELATSSEEVSAQPLLAKTLLEKIREVHQESLLTGLEGVPKEGKEAGGARGAGRKTGGGEEAASASGGSGGAAALEASWYETDALGLVPFFSEQASTTAGEMNFLNKTSGAMSLASDVAGIANSIGQGGNLAGFLRDLGHTCCSSPASLRQAIRESGVMVDERQVAQVITMLANNYNNTQGQQGDDRELSSALTNSLFSTGEGQMAGEMSSGGGGGSGGQGLWRIEVARQVLAEDYGPRLDWVAVAKAFDHDGFNVPDQNALQMLLVLYRKPAGRDIPSEALYMQWQNRRGHLSLLRTAILASPQLFTFASSPVKQAPLEEVDTSAATPNGAWLSLDLVAALLSLASDTELYAQVRDVFSKPAYQCPELLLLALAAVPSEAGGSLRVEMLSRLLPLYFRPNRNTHAAALIRRLWQVNPRLVVQSGVKAFNVDSTLPSVVYVLRIMRLVPECAPELLGSEDCAFAIAVASVAFGAEVSPMANPQPQPPPHNPLPPLDLDKWCAERLGRKDREIFAASALSFVQSHFPTARLRQLSQKPGETPGESLLPTCAMSLEASAILLKSLGATGLVSPAAEALAKKNPAIQASAKQLAEAGKKMHPTLNSLLNPPEEIESMADSYFQRIYTAEQSIEEVIEMLERFKTSSDTREQEIFACMVHNLFDEYRFFHNYPEKELRITGILFGSLIQHQLVSSITLGIALRYVLEALRRPPGPDNAGKMFRFGMFALEQFKGRLGEWPQYCSHIVQIPHLVGNHPSLVEEIERSIQRQGGGGGGGAGGGGGGGGQAGGGGGAGGQGGGERGPVLLGPIRPPPTKEQSTLLAARSTNAGDDGGGAPAGAMMEASMLSGHLQQQHHHALSQQHQHQHMSAGQGVPSRVDANMAPVGRSAEMGLLAGGEQMMGQGGRGGRAQGVGLGQHQLQQQEQQQLQQQHHHLHPQQLPPQLQQQQPPQQHQSLGRMEQHAANTVSGLQNQQQTGHPHQQLHRGASSMTSGGPGSSSDSGSAPLGAAGRQVDGGPAPAERLGQGLGLSGAFGMSGMPQPQAAPVGAMAERLSAAGRENEKWEANATGAGLSQQAQQPQVVGGGNAPPPAVSGNVPRNSGPGRGTETMGAPSGALPPKQSEGLGTPNMDALMAKVEEPTALVNPPESVMDRIHFVINNVTASNLSSKVAEIKSHVQSHPEHHPWLANYLVVKRICTQPNFHELYLDLVKQLETPSLMDAILKSVFYNIGKLLRSQKIITSTSERSLLKNLGSWLGKITLGREKPVLQRELDLKELLFQGYETGRLIAVTPFVAKILEGGPSGNSRVFKPPNPWIMGIFSALHEMYELEDLKMNIKFEIEMLCQKFNVSLADVPKYGRLRTRMAPQKEKNPDFNAGRSKNNEQRRDQEIAGMVQAEVPDQAQAPEAVPDRERAVREDPRGVAGGGDQPRASERGQKQQQQPQDQQTVIPNLASYVTINPNLEVFAAQPHLKEVLKRSVPVAVDRAIREIIQPVVERSVTIACVTSKELVQKDFAMESDENKMRKAAHLMVSNLAGSLALVTCKEPLRVSIGSHMRQLLNNATPGTDQQTVELLVQQCSSDNLELGCMLIEKAATEKAMRDVDEAMAPSLQARRKNRETTGQPFYDMSIFNNPRYPRLLPDALRPKPGGLHPQQLLVYEAFQRAPRQPATVPRSPSGPAVTAGPPQTPQAPLPPSPAVSTVGNVPPPTPQGPAGAVAPMGRGGVPKGVELTMEQALSAWQGAIGRLDMAINTLLTAQRRAGGQELTLLSTTRDQEVSASLEEIVTIGKSVPLPSREDALTKFARAVFNRLFDMARGKEDNPANVPMLRVEVYAAVLELCLRTVKTSPSRGRKDDLLSQWYNSLPHQALAGPSSRKLHLGALKYFVQRNMIDLEKTDTFLARNIVVSVQGTQEQQQQLQDHWGFYAIALIRQCVFDLAEAAGSDVKAYQVATMKSFAKTLETLSQIQAEKRPLLARQFLQLASDLRVATHPHPDQRKMGGVSGDVKSPSMHGMKGSIPPVSRGPGPSAPGMVPGRTDPAGARDEVTQLLQYWMRLTSDNGAGEEKGIATFLQVLHQRNVLKTDEATERFLRVATDLVVEACLKSGRVPAPPSDDKTKTSAKQLNYTVVDPYSRLLLILVRSAKAASADPAMAVAGRLAMLNKVLSTLVRVLLQDFETKKAAGPATLGPFDQRPYFRILLNMLIDMNKPDRQLDNSNLQVLAAFASALHALQPAVCPGFAFAWLELVSHRSFMPNLLLAKQNKGWSLMHRLLVDLLVFMEPHLRRSSLLGSVRLLYQGMLRTLLVLLHDFPEFLSDYHLSFCDVIPPSCIQLRNLVLAAFPRSMRLPDPFTPNLKVDLLPEITLAPRVLSNYVAALVHNNIRPDLDKFLQTRHQPANFLHELPSKLRLPAHEASKDLAAHTGMTYNVSCINALVVYVGSQAILQLNKKTPVITHSAPMDVFHLLANKLDPEGRYFFLNAMANQLRYPNQHTHYFSCVLLYLFAEAQSEMVQEQITRILLERLIVHRPHPWGLLITFIELIKNPRYSFWSHSFTHCAPELERVFESVARSCMTPGAAGTGSGSEDTVAAGTAQ